MPNASLRKSGTSTSSYGLTTGGGVGAGGSGGGRVAAAAGLNPWLKSGLAGAGLDSASSSSSRKVGLVFVALVLLFTVGFEIVLETSTVPV